MLLVSEQKMVPLSSVSLLAKQLMYDKLLAKQCTIFCQVINKAELHNFMQLPSVKAI